MRVYETARRHPGRTGDITGIILLERGLGGAGTVLLGAIGFVLAVGQIRRRRVPLARGAVRARHVRARVPVLRALGAAAAGPRAAAAPPLSHRPAAPRAVRRGPPLPGSPPAARRRVRVHDGDPGGEDPRDLGGGRAVGIELGPRIYYVMGPLFFLVLLVPFTLNGIAVREAFFVSFLGNVGVAADDGVRGRDSSSSSSRRHLPFPARRSFSGRGSAAARGRARAWLRPARASPASSSRTTRCSGSSAASRASRGIDTVVVDNGSTDGTVGFVAAIRSRAVRVIEDENRGLAAGWNRGIEADIDRARARAQRGRVARRGRARPTPRGGGPASGGRAASARGCSTLTEASSAPCAGSRRSGGSRPSTSTCASSRRRPSALNAFYGAGFDHASERAVEWVMGACMFVRRRAFDEVGPFDERYFLFSEEVDWMRRAADHGWQVVFTPDARCVHVGGRGARRPAVQGERPRPPALPLAPRPARGRPSGRAGCCARRSSCAGGCTAASAGGCTATSRAGSGRATSRRCSSRVTRGGRCR